MGDGSYPECRAQELFDEFVSASTCRAALCCFSQLCEHLQLDLSTAERPLYRPIKDRLNYWKANALWAKLDRRAAQPEYRSGEVVCSKMTCVIIGAGPCGLRTAVELSFMGARVVVVEKRDSFSRNNVLHLWPFTIHDLRGLGAKKFYGRFCAGSIDHISIRQLQLVLLKVALLLGAEVHVNVEFKRLVEPPEDQRGRKGWRMEVNPKRHAVGQLDFDVIVGADGRRNTLPGFRRKEFRGKLAIAITANFKNGNSSAEAKVEEICGVAFIFNQRFFQELRQETGIDLENIVYYKDDTHYFVMTAKKQSLLEKGVILQDFADTEMLLSRKNIDQDAMLDYARQAADFSTNRQLPCLDFAMNHYGQPDAAMFDFTCMYASENAAMFRQCHGHQLLVTLVGDSLLEPFWPMGTGVARGFLAALDSAWMIRRWAMGGAPLEVLAERESLYRLLPQTTPENMQKNVALFSVDPATRYLNVSPLSVTPAQVKHLVDTGEEAEPNAEESPRLLGDGESNQLLSWCQEQTRGYRGVAVADLTASWKSGLALCALIHRHRPHLIDFDSLEESSVEENVCLAFDVAERELGIPPLVTVEEMSSVGEPDSLSMVVYLSQFYQLLSESPLSPGFLTRSFDLRSALVAPASLLSRLGTGLSRTRNSPELGKRRRTSVGEQESGDRSVGGGDTCVGGACRSRVRLMANQLQAKLDERTTSQLTSQLSTADPDQQEAPYAESTNSQTSPVQTSPWKPKKRTLQQEQLSFRFKEKIKSQTPSSRDDQASSSSSHVCVFCDQRVYVLERLSAEGFFFHRSCFLCFSCGESLRPSSYVYEQISGRFYCLRHPDCSLGAPSVKKRATPSASQRTSATSLSWESVMSGDRRRSSAASVTSATPERIELEIHSRSSMSEQDLQEVSEEDLNRFNLDHSNHETEEEEEEEEEGEPEGEEEVCLNSQSSNLQEQMDSNAFSVPMEFGSASPLSSQTPPEAATPSTAAFVTTPGSTPPLPAADKETAPTSIGGRGLSDETTSKLPPLDNWMMEAGDRALLSDDAMREGASHPPRHLLPRGGDLLLHLKTSTSRPAGGLWKVSFPPTRKQQKTTGRSNAAEKRGGANKKMEAGDESDLDSSTLVQRCFLNPPNKLQADLLDLVSEIQKITVKEEEEEEEQKLAYIPHALAFRRNYNVKKAVVAERVQDSDDRSSCPTEVVGVLQKPREPSSLSVAESLFQVRQDQEDQEETGVARRFRRDARRRAKRNQLKRLHRAQLIQRQLQLVDENQRRLEERGVMVERVLRGETGLCEADSPALMQIWFQLVQEKNSLIRYESKLMIFSRELELEDRQSRLQQELRRRMALDDHLKGAELLDEERQILKEMLEVVEQRNALVTLLEEQHHQDLDLDLDHGLGLNWT